MTLHHTKLTNLGVTHRTTTQLTMHTIAAAWVSWKWKSWGSEIGSTDFGWRFLRVIICISPDSWFWWYVIHKFSGLKQPREWQYTCDQIPVLSCNQWTSPVLTFICRDLSWPLVATPLLSVFCLRSSATSSTENLSVNINYLVPNIFLAWSKPTIAASLYPRSVLRSSLLLLGKVPTFETAEDDFLPEIPWRCK